MDASRRRECSASLQPGVASQREGFSRAIRKIMTHTIAVIAGDGIGREVIPAGIAAIEAAARGTAASVAFTELPWGSDYYLKHGRMMPDDGFEQLAKYDAIYLGALGA